MNTEILKKILDKIRVLLEETEWVELKVNYVQPEEIGEYISTQSSIRSPHDCRQIMRSTIPLASFFTRSAEFSLFGI